MLRIDENITPADFNDLLERFWRKSGQKIQNIEENYPVENGSPVFTVDGKYTTRGWTEWTQGFQHGSALLQFEATGDPVFLELGRRHTVSDMAPHLSHIGVHDHGFNNVSTYGNLLRLMKEGKIPFNQWEWNFYELAIKVSGAVQASRWTSISDGGFIFSFNGPHSLFVDTIRSCRSLMLSHAFGHVLMGENDARISLLERGLQHLHATAEYSVYYGAGRDRYDERGRTAHECIFNVRDGQFRCPNSQQGYTGRSTWTRGLAWAITGFSEQLEFIDFLDGADLQPFGDRPEIVAGLLEAARAVSDFYIQNSPADGIPYWDTGAPGLKYLEGYLDRNADPFNQYEPVDSSAAAIASQGLLRLGHYLIEQGDADGGKYWQAGLTVMKTLLQEPYMSLNDDHQGLILHSIYHEPNAWDFVPEGSRTAYGESSMWGDYHAREAAVYLQRIIKEEGYHTFFNCL